MESMVSLLKDQRCEIDANEQFSVSLPEAVYDKLKDDMVSGSFTATLLPNENWCDDTKPVAESQLVFEVEVRVLTVAHTS